MKRSSSQSGRWWRSSLRGRRRPAILVLIWLTFAAFGAVELANVQNQGRSELESRFRLRAETASSFVETYVSDFFDQERRAAARVLGGRMTTRGAFNRTITLLGAKAAVLLDAKGDVIESSPRDTTLAGANLSRGSDYLRSAVGGMPAVSNVVSSAVDGDPVIDFAVPYETSGVTRVLSGSFGVGSTPLAGYVRRAAVLAPNRVYLTDTNGRVFATNDPNQVSGGSLTGELADFSESSGTDPAAAHSSTGDYYVSQAVPGTPWRLVAAAPHDYLYAAVGGIGRIVPWMLWLGFLAGGLLSILLFERLSRRRQNLAELNQQLERLARIDMLTDLPNRRAAEEELERALSASDRYEDPLSILVVDIDYFKSVNDDYGHAAGDAALRHVADRISSTLRGADLAGRWAGDEFLLILPHLNENEAALLAQRLNDHVRRAPLLFDGQELDVQISIGVAQWEGESGSVLVDRADRALYAAKRAGRDTFSVAGDDATSPLTGTPQPI